MRASFRILDKSESHETSSGSNEPKTKRGLAGLLRKLAVFVALLVFLAAVGVGGWFFWKYQTAQKLLKAFQNPDVAAKVEVEQLTKEISKFYLLPDETPSLATVKDKSLLQSQDFFSKAENGDKVLIFTAAKKAMLYRPSTGQLINVAPLNIETSRQAGTQSETSAVASPVPSSKVAIYNGTTTAGLTTSFEKRLKDQFPQLGVATKQNATKTDYSQSVVVDVSGTQSTLVQQLSQKLGLKVATLPEGETKPDTDILIVLGTDATAQ